MSAKEMPNDIGHRPLRVVIADDEPLVRAELRDILSAMPAVSIEAEYRDGIEALEGIATLAPDVAFLDIRMPGFTGLEVAEQITRNVESGRRPRIVFVTAYDQYAIRAFEMDAVDYLLKPIDEARVRQTVDRVRQRGLAAERAVLESRLGELIAHVSARTPPQPYLQRLVVQTAGTLRVIPVEAVEWIEADDNYARVHTPAGSPLLRETLKSLESRLDPALFARVHRSAIVRLDRVRELKPQPSGDYQLRLESGAKVTMSRSHRDAVLERIGKATG